MNTSPIATWQVSSIWLHIWLTICLLWSQAAVGHLSWHLGRPSPEVGFRAKFLDLMTLSLENVTKWGRGVILPSLIKLGLMSLGCPQSDEVKPRGRAGWVAPVCADPTLWRRRGLGAFSTLCFIPSLGMWPWMSCLLVAGGDGRDGGECRTETLKLARVWRLGMWGGCSDGSTGSLLTFLADWHLCHDFSETCLERVCLVLRLASVLGHGWSSRVPSAGPDRSLRPSESRPQTQFYRHTTTFRYIMLANQY